ncbi:hypothetical protein [Pseudomonas cavernae]|nr:hypothetical protein [Pseudomonas cavernae]
MRQVRGDAQLAHLPAKPELAGLLASKAAQMLRLGATSVQRALAQVAD